MKMRSRTACGKLRDMTDRSEVLFIGGRSGVGKTSAALALHAELARRDIRHAVIDGDNLDLAYPVPWEHHLAEKNLAAIWTNYRTFGYRRLIYVNTVSVIESETLARAMGDDPTITSVLLRASDEQTDERLAQREHGIELARHSNRSRVAAVRLDDEAPSTVHRIETDGLGIPEVAKIIVDILGWRPAATRTDYIELYSTVASATSVSSQTWCSNRAH